MRKKQREHYIIDGYNIINYWPDLQKLREDLSAARDRLIHIASEYGAYEKYDITIVFDAAYTDGIANFEKVNPHLEVVYTSKGETADSYIERLAYNSVRDGREVHVVTSDRAEQTVILGSGAYRHPAMEFYRMVQSAKKHLSNDFLGKVVLPLSRNEVSANLDSETLSKLDKLRKGN